MATALSPKLTTKADEKVAAFRALQTGLCEVFIESVNKYKFMMMCMLNLLCPNW